MGNSKIQNQMLWMFWAKIDVLKKNKVCSGLLCKYFSHQNTHTTRMESVSQTWYQGYHCAMMPILSSRVWLPVPTSFSQANDILSSSLNTLISIFLTLPHLQPLRCLKTRTHLSWLESSLIPLWSLYWPTPTSSSALPLYYIFLYLYVLCYVCIY